MLFKCENLDNYFCNSYWDKQIFMVNIMLIPLLYCVKECDGNGGELYVLVKGLLLWDSFFEKRIIFEDHRVLASKNTDT